VISRPGAAQKRENIMALSTAVAAQDADFSPNAKPFAPGFADFNDPNNWVQGVVRPASPT